MAINKKLIHFKNKENFNTEVANGNILNTSIVFILDTQEIYTHGLFYDGSKIDLSGIEASILNIIDTKANKSDVEVEAPNGVYALTAGGKLIDYTTADSSCIGVAFISDNQKVMIAKANAIDGTNTTLYWGYNLNKQDVPNLENLADATAAKADYNGKANTAAIIAGYAALGKDMNSRDMCKVLETYNEGGYTDWYVPAAGQLYEFYSNKAALNEALAAINGTAFLPEYYWSSSEEATSGAWYVDFDNDDVGYYRKNKNYFVCFVRDLTIKKTLKEKVSELESNKADKTEIPTKVGLLENDSDYITKTEVADSYLVKGNYVEEDIYDGVYAVDANGQLIDYNTADSSCLGVALVKGEHKFMIAKSDATDGTNTTLYWGKNLYQKDVAGITNISSGADYIGEGKKYGTDFTTWSTGPVVDFNGAANTAAIIAGYAEHGVSMDARDMCTVLNTFNSSDSYNDWYVPAAGQLALMYLAKTDIHAALAKIGGTAFNESDLYWSSSEYGANNAWNVNFNNGFVFNGSKNRSLRVRFVRDISVKTLKERVTELEDNIPTKLSQLENDVPYALKSDVEVEVEVENGVYIVDLNGALHDSNAFTGTADDVTGIGLVTDKTKMIIALDEWYSYSESTAWNGNIKSAWGGYQKTVTGCFSNSNQSQALLDFDGEVNTDTIIAQLKDTTDSYSQYYTGAPAAEYCRAYSKGYKDIGSWYLPAAGELNEIVLNKDAINAILTKLGKNNLSKNTYTWSSSQSTSYAAWCYYWSNSRWDDDDKRSCFGVRPICKLELKKPLKERIKDLESNKANKADVEIEVEVEVPNGVYAITVDGELIDYNLADATATGVALVAGEHKFMIAKSDATDGSNTRLYWGKNLRDKDVAGVVTNGNVDGTNGYGNLPKSDGSYQSTPNLSGDFTTWTAGALAEFNGAANTAAIIAGYTEHAVSMDARDMCTVLNTFNAADSYKDWYVPACGQLALMWLNMTEINAALANIGGTALTADYYLSSSECSSNYAWIVSFRSGRVYYNGKDASNWVRFVRDLTTITTTIKKPLKEKVSELESSVSEIELNYFKWSKLELLKNRGSLSLVLSAAATPDAIPYTLSINFEYPVESDITINYTSTDPFGLYRGDGTLVCKKGETLASKIEYGTEDVSDFDFVFNSFSPTEDDVYKYEIIFG